MSDWRSDVFSAVLGPASVRLWHSPLPGYPAVRVASVCLVVCMVVDAMVAHSPAAVGREIITGDRIRGQVCFSSQVIFRSNVGKGSAVQEIITAAETQGSCSYDDIKDGILDKIFHMTSLRN